ncbi:thiazole synthase [Helicovermis profundi]
MDNFIKDKDLVIGTRKLNSRLLIGTGKYPSKSMISKVIEKSHTEVVTMALRRIDTSKKERNILDYIPKNIQLLPNTSGARNAEEAIRIAKIAKEMGCGNWIKLEIIDDNKHLLPNNYQTIKATETLSKLGFVVLPYMSPDLSSARSLVNAGASTIMPLGSPIGSNRGIRTEEMIRILIEEIDIPLIVDAGIGKPSDAAYAMEMGADAVLVNTAIATSNNPINMAEAFSMAVEAGRIAYVSKLGRTLERAEASSPLTGFLGE